MRYTLSLLGMALFLLPHTALACSCYDQNGNVVSVDETATCQEVCGTSNATATGEGICDCGDGTSQEISCDAICEEAYPTLPSSSSSTSAGKSLTPRLNIDIPTVTFSEALTTQSEGRTYVSSNYLGEYISGVYVYMIGFGTTIAIVFIIISGLQWALAPLTSEGVKKAQARIKHAVTGLVLLLSTYLIIATVNPELLFLQMPELQIIEGDGIHENEDDFVNGTVALTFGPPASANISGKGMEDVPTELILDIEAVAEKLEAAGFGMTISSSYRTVEEQKRLIGLKCKNPPGSATCDPKDGKTAACILKDNDPANCPHTTGKALDIWGTKLGSSSQCITQVQCEPSLGSKDPCRLNECQAALITAMKEQGFCNLRSEAWHFEKPKMSSTCN